MCQATSSLKSKQTENHVEPTTAHSKQAPLSVRFCGIIFPSVPWAENQEISLDILFFLPSAFNQFIWKLFLNPLSYITPTLLPSPYWITAISSSNFLPPFIGFFIHKTHSHQNGLLKRQVWIPYSRFWIAQWLTICKIISHSYMSFTFSFILFLSDSPASILDNIYTKM